MHFLMTGGTGFIGSAVCAHLNEKNHSITLLTQKNDLKLDGVKSVRHVSEIASDECYDAIVNLAGEPIADQRWSKTKKQKIIKSRLGITEQLLSLMSRLKYKPSVFISSSAIGYYGIYPSNNSVTEIAEGDNSFSSRLCSQWESLASQACDFDIRTCLLRTGIVLGEDGGALKKMRLPFALGLGGEIGSGEQWMSWIHMDDMVRVIEFCVMNDSVSGPVNCTAPQPVTNKVFTKILAAALNRPAILPMPAFMVKLLFGQMGDELLLAGKKVYPDKLERADFTFNYNNLNDALREILLKVSPG